MSSTPGHVSLFDRLPYSMRSKVASSGEFQRLLDELVRKHVQQQEAGGSADAFLDELDKLKSKPDYIAACRRTDVCVAEKDGRWCHFAWDDWDTIPYEDGESHLDLARWASDNGLQLDEWRWLRTGRKLLEPVHVGEIGDGDSVLSGPALEAAPSIQHAFALLKEAAARQGKADLANALGKPQNTKALFEAYVDIAPDLTEGEYESEAEAAEAACTLYDVHDLGVPEVYEYWTISDWLAYALEQKGEVIANDFMDTLTVWGRRTTGQAISMDGIIREIASEHEVEAINAIVERMYPNLGSDDEHLQGVPLNMLRALEEGRVKRFSGTHETTGGPVIREYTIVASPLFRTDKAWLLDKQRPRGEGVKDSQVTGAEAINWGSIAARLATDGEEKWKWDAPAELDASQVDRIVEEIGEFHRQNRSNPNHKVPENLEARLSALSPAYAARLQSERNAGGPSI